MMPEIQNYIWNVSTFKDPLKIQMLLRHQVGQRQQFNGIDRVYDCQLEATINNPLGPFLIEHSAV